MKVTVARARHTSAPGRLQALLSRQLHDGLLARVSTTGLLLVLLSLGAFALWPAHSTSQSTRQAIASSTLSVHYTSAAAAVAAQESLERKYRLEPGKDVLARHASASKAMLEAIALVRRDGDAGDQAVADQVERAYGPYHEAITRMFAAVDRQDTARVLQIDNDEVDPRFDLIEHTVNEAADAHHAAALKDLAGLQTQQAFIGKATPVVFSAGLLLLIMFASVLGWTRRQLDTQRLQAERDALHDSLTGLPNRTLLADRLAQSRRTADTVSRLGGDECAVLLPEVEDVGAALEVATRIRTALARSFKVEGIDLDVDASIGVVVSGLHGSEAQTLLQRADVAMYVAKQKCCGVAPYDPDHEELLLHYQPKVSLSSGEWIGVEALVRWQHPQRGLVPPIEFIPLAEHTGLIGPLTTYVLNAALAQARAWADAGRRVPVAVNISARNLADDGFPGEVRALLARHGVPASLLAVELTESAVMLDPERAAVILQQLHAQGVRIAIDDFGAGYTSLAQLKHLPVSELKIDRSFVTAITSNADDALIVRSMIDLGHSLQLTVVAEGVENMPSAQLLANFRCDVAQGYHLGRPMSADALGECFRQRSAAQRGAGLHRLEQVHVGPADGQLLRMPLDAQEQTAGLVAP